MTLREATPVTDLKLGMMNQNEVARVQGYLETKLHCTMTYMSEGYYLIRFPNETREQVSSEPDPRYQQESLITLPNGATLRKVVHWPCTHPGCTHTRLLLLDEAGE